MWHEPAERGPRKPTLGKFIFAVAELIVYLVPRLPARYSHIYELLVHLYHYLLLVYQFVLFSRRNSNHTRRDRRADTNCAITRWPALL